MSLSILTQLKQGGNLPVIFFPYLGGHANVYRELAHLMPDSVTVWGVTMPGHGSSLAQPRVRIADLVRDIVAELREHDIRAPFFYGHSLGGVVAYFVANYLMQQDQTAQQPLGLMLSASHAPQDFLGRQYASMTDEALIKAVESLGRVAQIDGDMDEVLRYFLPVFRADFLMLEDASEQRYSPVSVPCYYMYGESDRVVPFAAAARWLPYFSRGMTLQRVVGGSHMFVHTHQSCVAECLVSFIHEVCNDPVSLGVQGHA